MRDLESFDKRGWSARVRSEGARVRSEGAKALIKIRVFSVQIEYQ